MFLTSQNEKQVDIMARDREKFPLPDFNRVGGGVICELCGHEYYDHPQHIPYIELTILCDGRVVKL